jgi:hypothetical protein
MHVKAALTINAHDHGMRLFLAAVIIILLCAADRAYMGGANMRLAMSGAKSIAAVFNRKADDVLAYLKR